MAGLAFFGVAATVGTQVADDDEIGLVCLALAARLQHPDERFGGGMGPLLHRQNCGFVIEQVGGIFAALLIGGSTAFPADAIGLGVEPVRERHPEFGR